MTAHVVGTCTKLWASHQHNITKTRFMVLKKCVKVLDFPFKQSLNLFKPVLKKPSLSRLSLAKPSLNQVSACHLKTSFSKTRFNLKPGLFFRRFVTLSMHTARRAVC